MILVVMVTVSVMCTVNFVLFTQTDERISVTEDTSFVDYQTNLVRLAKQIARTAQDMVIMCSYESFCFVLLVPNSVAYMYRRFNME